MFFINLCYITVNDPFTPGPDFPHFLESRCLNSQGLRFHGIPPQSVTPYSVIWHYRSCFTVPTTLDKPYVIVCRVLTCRVAWCHLIYVGEKYLIDSACGYWGGAGDWIRFHWCTVPNFKSYITLSNSNNKNKSSVFSILMCFYNIRQKSCGVVWDEETMGTMDDKTMMASLKCTPDD